MPREKIAIWSDDRANRISVRPMETLSGNRAITLTELDSWQAFSFDPGGAGRDVTLPATKGCQGAHFILTNQADNPEILTIKDAAGVTVVTPTQAETAFCWCDGVKWYGSVGDNS